MQEDSRDRKVRRVNIMESKKLTSKKIGIILMIIFILSLGSFTIYSRGYVQRQKPLVNITLPESTTLRWTYETRSTIEPAAPVYAATGVEWTIDVFIPLSAFEDYLSELLAFQAEAIADNTGWVENLERIDRKRLDCGGYNIVFNYNSPIRNSTGFNYIPGEEVTVFLEHNSAESYDFMIPFSAINHDPLTGTDYIFTVHRRSGAWGYEYYVEQQNIMFGIPKRIGDLANILPPGSNTATPIVYWSEHELHDGMLVRLWD